MTQKTIDTTQPAPGPAAPLPHERDESVGNANPKPDERIVKGRRDVERGVQDTSRAPESDRAYREQKK